MPRGAQLKRALIFIHRWMGVVFCLLFSLWFASGIVMMYWSYPEISDAAYDKLMERLKEFEAAHPELVTPHSPTVRVGGAPRDGFQTVRHARAMLSLDNAFSYDVLRDFDRRVRQGSGKEKIEYIAEHKFDGLSISLQYEDGVLVRGVTRGDGTTGEDVTPNVKTIRSIPLQVDTAVLKKAKLPSDFEVRGEVLMTRKAFEALNRQQEQSGGKIFVNARNSAAGAVRVLDPSITGVYSNAGLTGMLPLVAVVTPERGSMALTMLACLLPPERSPASTAVWRRRREGLSSQPASATS